MKIWFILMQFPAPREVFANNDVEMLKRYGDDISVHSLRPKHKLYLKLIKERDLSALKHSHSNFSSNIHGLLYGFNNFMKLSKILTFIITNPL